MSKLNLGDLESTVLVFGGPYSNLAATEALFAEAKKREISPSNIICTGDVVAYSAEPEECSQLLKESNIHVLMGNCEESIAEGSADCGCGFEEGSVCSGLSQNWYSYTQSKVSESTRAWMRDLPRQINFSLAGHSCAITHGSFSQINQFIFASTDSVIKQKELELSGAEIVIGGHSGIPFGQHINEKLWLNAGVIGLPANDGTSEGWYLILEPNESSIEVSWHRLTYDFNKSFESMTAAGLRDYAGSIKSGLWPSMDILPEHERKQRGLKLQPEHLIFN